jgi:thiol-disulfide isomerase/thioredoxin
VTRRSLAATIAAVGLLLAACGTEPPSADVQAAPEAEPPSADAVLEDGAWPEVAAFVRHEQRPTVVNLFASWCGPCRVEAPVFRRAVAAYDDVAFLGVAHQDRREAAARFLEEERLAFPTLFDPQGHTAAELGTRGMPVTAFFAADGRLVHVHVGLLTEPILSQRLADLRADARRTG